MPSYTLPQFNLTANVWSGELSAFTTRWSFLPPVRARDFQTPCQLYIQQRVTGSSYAIPFREGSNVTAQVLVRIDLRVPAGTSIRYPLPNNADGSSTFDLVEVPAGSGKFYFVVFVTPVHQGFANEYLLAVLIPYTNFQQPEDATLELHDSFVVAAGSLF